MKKFDLTRTDIGQAQLVNQPGFSCRCDCTGRRSRADIGRECGVGLGDELSGYYENRCDRREDTLRHAEEDTGNAVTICLLACDREVGECSGKQFELRLIVIARFRIQRELLTNTLRQLVQARCEIPTPAFDGQPGHLFHRKLECSRSSGDLRVE